MKILMVSNLYPPHYVGGYELRCAQVAEALCLAGHEVRVLTSRYGLGRESQVTSSAESIGGVRIHRLLGQYHHGPQTPAGRPYFWLMIKLQLQDARHFARVLDEFKPQIVNWWAISGLTKALLPIPKLRGIPDLFCIDDDWIIEESKLQSGEQRPPWASLWGSEGKRWYSRLLFGRLIERWKKSIQREGIVTSPASFSPTHVCFVSEFLRADYESAGFRFPSAEVIHGGASVAKFLYRRGASMENRGPVRLLYAGQITQDRGLHTAIKALSFLSPAARSMAALTVVGDWNNVNYRREIEEMVRSLNLSERVTFIGKKTSDEMPAVYRAHDLLIFPSLRKEGLPLTMMEAMLSGCAVVTTGSGGAIEIAQAADLPLFPKGDAEALSRLLEGLITDRESLCRIGRQGQEAALHAFTFDRMIERLCHAFQRTCAKENVGRTNYVPAIDGMFVENRP